MFDDRVGPAPRVAMSPVVRLRATARPSGAGGRALARAAAAPPGPAMIADLARVEPDLLDDTERVLLLQCWERAARWLAAQQARAVVGVAGPRPVGRDDEPRELVRLALLGQGGSPRACVDTARALAGPLAVTAAALARGEVSADVARVLAAETAHLPDRLRTQVAERLTGRAAGRTPAQVRRAARREVIRVDPAGADAAAAAAARRRQVNRAVEPDGQATLTVTGPAVEVATIWTTVDLRARPHAADDPRTLDQRRFDTLVALCRAAAPSAAPGGGARSRGGLRPTVHLHATAATWAGLDADPVELDGYGPLPPGAAREHLTSSTWRAVVTDALGTPIGVSDPTYTPRPRTRRLLALRDRGCQAPGCPAPPAVCDADHNRPHEHDGPTDTTNCGLLCRHHHRLKTHHGWTWTRQPDQTSRWTSPHGQTWTNHPDPHPAAPADPGGNAGAPVGTESPAAEPPGTSPPEPPPTRTQECAAGPREWPPEPGSPDRSAPPGWPGPDDEPPF